MTRQEARKARQATGSGLSIYRCDDHYHIGHGRGLSREVHRRMRGDE